MVSILIDTALLAIPNYAEDETVASQLIDRVTHFSQLAGPDFPVRMVAMNNLEDVIWSGNIGPDFQNIAEFLEIMGLSEVYTAQDLFRQYTYLMENSFRLSDCCSTSVTACSNVEVMPELPEAMFPLNLAAETETVLIQLCAPELKDKNWFFGSSLFASSNAAFEVSGCIDQVETLSDATPISVPLSVKHKVQLFHNAGDLVSTRTAVQLWVKASTEADLHFAVTVGALAIRRAAGKSSDVSDLMKFRIGSKFMESLRANQCSGSARFSTTTCRICMEIVADCHAGHIRQMGIGSQAKRLEDGALGYRLHVTGSGIALRMLFWKVNDFIEFANVGPKFELTIEEGRKSASVALELAEIFDF
ncbi:MAG: hypothetical protein ABJV68_03930 [Paracoccaceae bacterium]